MQPRLRIRVLPLKAQVAFQWFGLRLDDLRDGVALVGEDTPRWVGGDGLAPGGVVRGPDEVAVGVSDFAWGAEVVDAWMEALGMLFPRLSDHERQRVGAPYYELAMDSAEGLKAGLEALERIAHSRA